MITASLMEPAAGSCSRSHHGPGLWAVQLFWPLKKKILVFFTSFLDVVLSVQM